MYHNEVLKNLVDVLRALLEAFLFHGCREKDSPINFVEKSSALVRCLSLTQDENGSFVLTLMTASAAKPPRVHIFLFQSL
jgi:hypothetical protein